MTTTPDLLTVPEVAAFFRVSESTVNRWRQNGTLSAVKVGGTLRFRRSEVERLVTPEPETSAS